MARWIIDAEGFKRIIDGNGEVEVHQPYVKIILRGNGNGESVVIIPWSKINQLIFIE
ncbi:MAG: hypothetical protein QXQ41_05265 [Candidatus Bathyarchaeia archaeon]